MWKELVRGSDHRAFLALGDQCRPPSPNTGDSLTNSCCWWQRPQVLGSSLTLMVCSHTTPLCLSLKDCSMELSGGFSGTLHGQEVWGFFFFVVLWMEPKAYIHQGGNWSTAELHPQPLSGIYSREEFHTE